MVKFGHRLCDRVHKLNQNFERSDMYKLAQTYYGNPLDRWESFV